MTSRTTNATRNIVFGVIQKIVGILLPFATRTVMIYVMGMQYVGLGSLFTSVLSVLSFAELGIGSALVFSMYKPIAEDDEAKVNALMNFYKKAYRVIGIIILVIGLAIMPFIRNLIAGDVPFDINIYFLYAIYLVNNILGYFLFAYKQALFSASQRVDKISLVGTITQLLSGVLQIEMLIVFKNYYAFAIVCPIITCINNVIIAILAKKYFPQYKCAGHIEKEELKEIKKKVGGMFFQKVGGVVLFSVDSIVISSYLGLISLGIYQNCYLVFTALNGFFSVIMISLVPIVGNAIVTESIENNYKGFKKYNFIYYWLAAVCGISYMCMINPFVEFWVGSENILEWYMCILFGLYLFIFKWLDMSQVYLDARGMWWETRFVPIVAAILNLTLNILLVQIIGLAGILLSTIISIFFVYDIVNPLLLFKHYFKASYKSFVIEQSKYFVSAIIAGAVTYGVCSFVNFPAVVNFLVRGCICLFLPNLILWLLLRNSNVFKDAKCFVIDIISKVRK